MRVLGHLGQRGRPVRPVPERRRGHPAHDVETQLCRGGGDPCLLGRLAPSGRVRRFVVLTPARESLPHAEVGAPEDRVAGLPVFCVGVGQHENLERCASHDGAGMCRGLAHLVSGEPAESVR